MRRNGKTRASEADGGSGWGPATAGIRVLVIVGLVGVGALVDAAWGQGGKAVVTGAERVVVRRGPGREFPPFASVSRGESVDVQEIKGEWARINTRRGEAGYVNSTFLALPGEHERRVVPVSATATPSAATPTAVAPTAVAPTVTAAPAAARSTVAPAAADTGRTATLEADVRRLREELAAATSRTLVPTAAPAVPVVTVRDIEPLREQLQQTLAALDALQRRVEATGAPADGVADESSIVSSHSLFLLVVGLLAGWVAHTVYGRTSDRGYRSRIRF